MPELDELLAAVIDVVNTTVMPKTEVRNELAARGVELGELDRFGLDDLDRVLHLNPALALVGSDDVAHLPTLFHGISWSVPVSPVDARNGFLPAAPLMSPLVDMMLDGDVALLGDEDTPLGVAQVDTAEVDGVGTDVVVLPHGLLDALAGETATFTITGTHTVAVAPATGPAEATPAQINAMQTAFEARSNQRKITRPLDGVEVAVQSAQSETVAASMVATDRDAFTDGPIAPLDVLVEAAGLSLQRGLIGAGDTDWDSLRSWLAMNRIKLDHELTDEQAIAVVVLTDAMTSLDADFDTVAASLDDAKVAEIAWWTWAEQQLVGDPLIELVGRLGDATAPGATWLRARQQMVSGTTAEAITLLESVESSGHAMVLADLAAFAADRSDPAEASRLLTAGGWSTEVDLDEEYDPANSTAGFGRELAEEIAPFAAMRPKPMAGRNDTCPCGSGRKYKQCHLGNELHHIEHRAGWLYVKMMRFMQLTGPGAPALIADTIVSDVESDDLRRMLRESYLPIDLALHEGRVADQFLEAKRDLLPADEVALVESWIASTRSVYEVARSTTDEMDVIDLATRERYTVRDTVPEEPLETGWKVIGRLSPVDGTHRAYSGFLPVNDDMVEVMLAGFGTRQLDTVALTIGQIFQTAETQDGMQQLFDDNLDDTELRALIEEMGNGELL